MIRAGAIFRGNTVYNLCNMLQQCEKQLSVLNITLLRKQAEMEVRLLVL